ncbi:MAG: HEAT repeat domain-containing protein [Chloroflexi bacterium]|nr:HEAT repeat domain-containing protein [Chloroflexota bacterium]
MSDDHTPRLGGAQQSGGRTPGLGGEAAISHVIEALHSEDDATRERAVLALEQIGGERALTILLEALTDANRTVVRRAVRALGRLGDARAVEPLMALWEDRHLHRDLIVAFGLLADPRPVARLLESRQPQAAWALERIAAAMHDADTQRRIAAWVLAQHNTIPPESWFAGQGRPIIAGLLHSDDPAVRLRAAHSLALLADQRGTDALVELVEAHSTQTTRFARQVLNEGTWALAMQGDPRLLDLLRRAVRERSVPLLNAVLGLPTHALTPLPLDRLRDLVPALVALLDDLPDYLRDSVAYLLRFIDTPEAHAAVDAYVDQKVRTLLVPYLRAAAPRQDADFISAFDHNLLERMLDAPAPLGYRDHPLMREHAFPMIVAWLEATSTLGTFADPDGHHHQLVRGLGPLGDPRALPFLRQILSGQSTHAPVDVALEAAAYLGGPEEIPLITPFLDDMGSFFYQQELAIDALLAIGERTGDPAVVAALVPLLNSEVRAGRSVRYLVAVVLGQIGHPAAVEPLLPLLADPDAHMVSLTATALGLIAQAAGPTDAVVGRVRAALAPLTADSRLTRHEGLYAVENRSLGDHVQDVLAAIEN